MSTSDLQSLAKQYGGVIPREKAGDAVRALYKPKRRKYRNEPVTAAGERFDSKGEQRRWEELRLMELAGEICDLKRQVRVPLLGGDNKPILFASGRQATYVADFAYWQPDAECRCALVLEDFKGHITAEAKLKMAIVQAMYGRPVRITRKARKE